MLYTLRVNKMDDFFEVSLLLDFYGPLLTQRQYEILDLYVNNDYSLGEIAENLNISRQGVHDNIKRAKNFLNGLEQKLGLMKRFLAQKRKAEKLLEDLNGIDQSSLSPDDRDRLGSLKDGITDLVSGL